MLHIDGSYKSGGGQILRTALALSTLTHTAFSIDKIRSGKPKPGLKPQHLTCIKALKMFTNCHTENAEIESEKLEFTPGKITTKSLKIDIRTAGSITLLLQSLLPTLLFCEKKIKLTIKGGTDVSWSTPIDNFNNVILLQLRPYTNSLDLKILKRGYYPRGGGEVELIIDPKYKLSEHSTFEKFHQYLKEQNKPIQLTEQPHLIKINGIVNATKSLMKANVGERIKKSAQVELKSLGVPINIRVEYCDSLSDGCGITLWATFSKDKNEITEPIILGADSLGKKGKKSEDVGTEAAQKLIKEIKSGAVVDKNTTDNLLPYLALFQGQIKTSQLTNHTLTNIYIIEQFLGKTFNIDEQTNIITTKNHQHL
tara:strand:- start:8214 stop:9317 length:1104 start_codon:yes stop_codon:yes gene_type:complete